MKKFCRIAVGVHACKEALQIRAKNIVEIWALDKASASVSVQEILKLAHKHSVPVLKKTISQLDKIATSHQGVAVFINKNIDLCWKNTAGDKPQLLLALDGVTDPHNVGAVIRTAWLMGAEGLLLSATKNGTISPAAHKVASGGVEHLQIDNKGSLYDRLIALKNKNFWVFGLDAQAKRGLWSQDNWPDRLVLVLGSEQKGLGRSTKKACDELICLPQKEASASYNVSVAASLAMAEYRRQHKKI